MKMNIKFLKGKKVYLRPLLKRDVILLLKWINDPDIYEYLMSCHPAMEEDEEKWIDDLHKNKGKDVVLMICLVNENKPIGTMGLHGINHMNGTATTGALIGVKDCWGKGYGTEAKMLLLNYAFNTLNLRKVCSSVLAFNKRSYGYSKKCGYIEEGTLKKHNFANGRYVDEILLAVFKKDFMPLWRKFKKEHLF